MTLIAPVLPFGYHARPARADDVPAIHALITECDREVYERPRKDVGAIIADLGRPRLVPELDTVLVFDRTGSPAAWAWVDRRSEIDVHPEHRGRGLGTALLRWAQERGRQAGADRLVQIVPDGNAGAGALLRAWGYDPLLTSWLMEFRMPDEPALPRSPTGVSVRPYRDGDGPAVHLLVEDAFDEWQERRAAYEEWALRTVERPAFAPDQSTWRSPTANSWERRWRWTFRARTRAIWNRSPYAAAIGVSASPGCCCATRSARSTGRADVPARCGRTRTPARWTSTAQWAWASGTTRRSSGRNCVPRRPHDRRITGSPDHLTG